MPNICARFSPQCTIYAQDLCTIVLFPQCAIYVQDLCKIILFPSAQYMCKICTKLYLFPQCAIYAQDLHKIVLLSSMCNILTKSQVLLKELCHISHICSKMYIRVHFIPQCARCVQDRTFFLYLTYSPQPPMFQTGIFSIDLTYHCSDISFRSIHSKNRI